MQGCQPKFKRRLAISLDPDLHCKEKYFVLGYFSFKAALFTLDVRTESPGLTVKIADPS